jgi:hypothetical protein
MGIKTKGAGEDEGSIGRVKDVLDEPGDDSQFP